MKLEDFKIPPHARFRLKNYKPEETLGLSKDEKHSADVEKLAALHDVLFAEHKHALLIVLQGMDAAGKDGTIKHVMSGVNPQGCTITRFQKPTAPELDHDYLWRVHAAVPAIGSIGIFNRSHYEDVLVPRVHGLTPRSVIEKRYDEINAFESMLSHNGVTIVKFFLHMSREEQEKRLDARLSDPLKGWKASAADFKEREYWADYMAAYEDAIAKCSTKQAPWYVIPADHKWFRNYAISEVVIRTLRGLHMQYPEASTIVKSSQRHESRNRRKRT
jgi:PPK2 family polyphosphate:nucleotide phosphotransferase